MKNCTAIILAAGMGKRLGDITKDKPKPLIEVANKTLIEYALDFVKLLGVNDVFVVGGYHFDKLHKAVALIDPSVKFIENTEYEYQNLLSFAKALHKVDSGSILVYDADHIFKKETADAAATNMKDIAVYCSYDLSGDEEDVMNVRVDAGGNMLEMSKELKNYEAIYTGMFFIGANHIPLLKKCVAELLKTCGKKETRVEAIFAKLKENDCFVKAIDVGRSDWFEVDTLEDLKLAKKSLEV